MTRFTRYFWPNFISLANKKSHLIHGAGRGRILRSLGRWWGVAERFFVSGLSAPARGFGEGSSAT